MRWLGHVTRMVRWSTHSETSAALGSCGIQEKTWQAKDEYWRDVVKKDLHRMGLTWKEVGASAQDRHSWRQRVALCIGDAGWIKVEETRHPVFKLPGEIGGWRAEWRPNYNIFHTSFVSLIPESVGPPSSWYSLIHSFLLFLIGPYCHTSIHTISVLFILCCVRFYSILFIDSAYAGSVS